MSCFVPALAVIFLHAALLGGHDSSPQALESDAAMLLLDFVLRLSPVVIIFAEEMTLYSTAAPFHRELKHCVCKLPPTGKHMCAVCGASDVGAKSHFPRPVFAAAGKAQLPVRPLLCTHFLFGSVLGRRTYGLHTKTQGPEPIDSFIQSHIHFKVNSSLALHESSTSYLSQE